MGSEMCIRDRRNRGVHVGDEQVDLSHGGGRRALGHSGTTTNAVCLLYTSDAADERSSVDLGGRRIIKKQIN